MTTQMILLVLALGVILFAVLIACFSGMGAAFEAAREQGQAEDECEKR